MTQAPPAIILSELPPREARAIFDALPAGKPERLAWKRRAGGSHAQST